MASVTSRWALCCLLLILKSTTAQMPTSDPTSGPSASPTIAPIAMPTQAPVTLAPVASPTTAPTESPTMAPTESPTMAPTVSPTMAPTLSPTMAPTASPTMAPATAAPVISPTAAPVTAAPVTTAPTSSPMMTTAAPQVSMPTMMPTMNDTEAPSLAPVGMSPTATPTMNETMPPTGEPTMNMTDSPTSSGPTGAPAIDSSPPTMSPVDPPAPVMFQLQGIVMELTGVSSLESADETIFQDTTDMWYLDSLMRRRLQSSGVTLTDSQTTFVSQAATTEGGDKNSITYDQTLTYTSETILSESQKRSLFTAPFADDTRNMEFTEALRTSGSSAFAGISSSVSPPELPPVPPNDDGDDGLSTGAIAGIAVGGSILLMAVGYGLYSYSNRQGGGPSGGGPPPQAFSIANSEDISPTSSPNRPTGSAAYGDQSVATVDYDYTKAYGNADASVVSSAGGTLGENTRQTNQDSALGRPGALGAAAVAGGYDPESQEGSVKEEIIEIIAPSGKLGVVIDTPDDGAPVVHAVKESSVIADQIRVGDKLVSVDEQDVTAMTAIKVSKLISKKSANPSRKLTVIRSSMG